MCSIFSLAQKEYEQLRNPDLLGGATIGEELCEPLAGWPAGLLAWLPG